MINFNHTTTGTSDLNFRIGAYIQPTCRCRFKSENLVQCFMKHHGTKGGLFQILFSA